MSNRKNDCLQTSAASVIATCLTLSILCGCSTLGPHRSSLDASSAGSIASQETTSGTPTSDAPANKVAPRVDRPAPENSVITVAHEEPIPSGSQVLHSQYRVSDYVTGYPAAMCEQASCGGCQACIAGPANPTIHNVQEYIFDGGDQQPQVVIRKDWSAMGIDPTDTVVYYETVTGEVCVQPTNRVPIYAPRFAAVRQVTGAVLAANAIGTQRVLAPIQPGRINDQELVGSVMQPLGPLGEQQVNLIDAFQENVGGLPVAGVMPPQRMSEARVPFEEIDVLRTGRITDEEIAVLGRILQNARTWFVPESLDIMIEGQSAALIADSQRPQDIHVYEVPGKCTLRICKTASHTIANPGDIVRFTIRFDNAGVKPIGNVVILDSLAPRLEYIEGSQQCSLETRFSAQSNEVGSQVLRWEIGKPIEKLDGGVISFDCRVR